MPPDVSDMRESDNRASVITVIDLVEAWQYWSHGNRSRAPMARRACSGGGVCFCGCVNLFARLFLFYPFGTDENTGKERNWIQR